MGLCITSIVKTLTDNHTLDDRYHQGNHTTLLLSETLLSTCKAFNTFAISQSDMSRCLASSGQHLVDGEGLSGSSSGSSMMVPPPTPQTNHWHGYSSVSPDRLISRRCDPQWSPHSPDLNLHIFICGEP